MKKIILLLTCSCLAFNLYGQTIYQNSFADPYTTYPYIGLPEIQDPAITQVTWKNDVNNWTYNGVNRALILRASQIVETNTITATFNLAAASDINITGFDFSNYQNVPPQFIGWELLINGTTVGQGDVFIGDGMMPLQDAGMVGVSIPPITNATSFNVQLILHVSYQPMQRTFSLGNVTVNGTITKSGGGGTDPGGDPGGGTNPGGDPGGGTDPGNGGSDPANPPGGGTTLPVYLVGCSPVNAPTGQILSGTKTNNITQPSSYSTPLHLNYQRTFTPTTGISNSGLVNETSNQTLIQMQTDYYDGLGRNIQSIARSYDMNNFALIDIITPFDNRLSVNQYSYLPYTVTESGSYQHFVVSPFLGQQGYYNSLYPAEQSTSYCEQSYYSDANTRSVSMYSPGLSNVGQKHGITTTATSNAYDVIEWSLGPSSSLPVNTGYYPVNTLIDTSSVTSDGLHVDRYYDMDGKFVCQKIGNGSNTDISYFVYDNYGRLIYNISPKATAKIVLNGGSINQTIADNLCDYVMYDSQNRKKLQHKAGEVGNEYFVYDNHNRLMLTQTPALNNETKWEFILYDKQDRPMVTGTYNTNYTWDNWQTILNGTNTTFTTDPSYLPYYLIHDNEVYPVGLTSCVIMGYTYYDSYDNPGINPSSPSANPLAFNANLAQYPTLTLPSLTKYSLKTCNQVTGKVSRVVDGTTGSPARWITTVYYYDDYGRVIQTCVKNAHNGIDISSNAYDFLGNLLTNYMVHYNPDASSTPVTVYTNSSYATTTKKLTTVTQSINGGPQNTLISYSYNNLGQLIKKVSGNTEMQNYDYNIRGQLTGINKDYAENGNTNGNPITFGESIKYDAGFTRNYYCGNVAGIIWRDAGATSFSESTLAKAYGYSYDFEGRLNQADYREDTNGVWTNRKNDYTEACISYDANGNIATLKRLATMRTGTTVAPAVVDDLVYTCGNGDISNQVTSVTDNIDKSITTSLDFDFKKTSSSTNAYSYDNTNGNLLADDNKGISFTYSSFINKPVTTSLPGGYSIGYTYDAEGNKLKESYSVASPYNVDYIGRFTYKNNTLSAINFPDGYASYENNTWNYYYFVKDHLGNVRNVVMSHPELYDKTYTASHEPATPNLEDQVFSDIENVRVEKPDGTGVTGDDYCAGLPTASTGNRVGTSIMLHVMSGDEFNASVQTYYRNGVIAHTQVATNSDMLAAVTAALSGGPGVLGAGEGTASAYVGSMFNANNYDAYYNAISGNSDISPAAPYAYLNYVLFDEQFHVVGSQSGLIQAGSNPFTWNTISTSGNITIGQPGYLVVYVSDEDSYPVWFDHLNVSLNKGDVVEQHHYYPFGLSITTASMNSATNRYLYQGKMLENTDNANLYDFDSRQYDPQLGRFLSIDPAQQFPSGYTGMGNNPVSIIDPSGTEGWAFDNCTGLPIYIGDCDVTSQEALDGAGYTDFTWVGISAFGGTDNDGNLVSYNSDGTISPVVNSMGEVTVTPQKSGLLDLSAQIASAAGISLTVKTEMIEYAVRDYSDFSKAAFKQLDKYSKTSAEVKALGKAGTKYLRFAKKLGVAGNIVGSVSAGYKLYDNPTAGNATRAAVQAAAIGAAYIPVYGWGVSLAIGAADLLWGDQFYNWIDSH